MTAATPGRRLGRYHLVEPLGGGPCGEVYRAKVVGVAGMERQLAVKRFHPQVLATPGVSGRLSQAARTYGGLDHPRLARLAELGVAGGETFTAVEWVNGLDLARLLTMAGETNAPLPAGASLVMISAAARAIGYAHGRGVSHLGLSPTNLIATGDGDIKITDVGILACRLPPRPSADPSLAARLAYLAPEQLIGEPVSAACDVFVLGVMAYELVNGARPFGGATALELEQAVLSGRPAPLELPRPVARVIDRCLARSPFERFPDARAFADALDAALRLSPLAGGKRDIADRVTVALEHIARINEQQLSGALSFAVPSAPQPAGRGASAVTNLPLPPPTSSGRSPAIPRPRPASVAPPAPPSGHTLRANPPAMPRAPVEQTSEPTLTRGEDDDNLAIGDQTLPRIQPLWPPTEQVPTLKPPPLSNKTLMGQAIPPPPPVVRPMGSNPPPFADGSPPPSGPPLHGAIHPPLPPAPPRMPSTIPTSEGPPPPPPPAPIAMPLPPPPPPLAMPQHAPPGPRVDRRLLIMMLVLVIAGVAGVGGFFVHRMLKQDGDPEAAKVATTPPPAIDAAVAPLEVAPVDAAQVAVAPPIDAPVAAPVEDGKLVIRSEPAGARVFIDGADQGKTPLTVVGTADRHNIAIVLAGYDLYLTEIDGRGEHVANLVAVTPSEGPGGIKVRCKADDRYYVFLDGKPTGQLCPTERLGVAKGEHAIETYDLVSETRRTFSIKVEKTSRSTRVRVD